MIHARLARSKHCRAQQCLIFDRPGGLGIFVRADDRFVVAIPDGLHSAEAAPLMSSGLTAYSAIRSSDVESGMNVAVVGLGGMGHIASQLLRNAGAHVTAVTSKHIDLESIELGVSRTLAPSTFFAEPPVDTFDRIFVTTGLVNDLDPFLAALTPQGTLVILGSPIAKVEFSVFKLNDFSGRRIFGSYIGSPDELVELLGLANAGTVSVSSTTVPFAMARDALDEVRQNTGGYRVVLERSCTTE